MTREVFLARLHERENFGRAVLSKIVLNKTGRACEFCIVTDRV